MVYTKLYQVKLNIPSYLYQVKLDIPSYLYQVKLDIPSYLYQVKLDRPSYLYQVKLDIPSYSYTLLNVTYQVFDKESKSHLTDIISHFAYISKFYFNVMGNEHFRYCGGGGGGGGDHLIMLFCKVVFFSCTLPFFCVLHRQVISYI